MQKETVRFFAKTCNRQSTDKTQKTTIKILSISKLAHGSTSIFSGNVLPDDAYLNIRFFVQNLTFGPLRFL